ENVCVVGDDDQCLVRGTPVAMADGTTRAIEEVAVGDVVRSAMGSGRFAGARVARVHVSRFRGEAVAITVEDESGSRRRIVSTPEHTHFAGFISGETPRLHFVYLMYKREVGFRVGITQMYTAAQKQPVPGYQLRVAQEHADALWIIGVHDDESSARLDEYLTSLRYALPTLPFSPRRSRRGPAAGGLVHDASAIAKVFAAVDTNAAAERLLADRGLNMEAPHHRPRSRNANRRNVVVTLCGDQRGARPMHRISMVGNDQDGRRRLEAHGLGVRAVRAESASWRHETARTSYAQLLDEVAAIRSSFGEVHVVHVARLGRPREGRESNSLPFTPAGSVLRGMSMFGADGELLRVVAVERVPVDDFVYDLDVEQTHNFVAEGIVTHNSIYGWRGADIRNILNFNKDFPSAHVVRLEENYRSKPPILALANEVIKANAGRMGKTLRATTSGGERVTSVMALDERDEADFVVEEITKRRAEGNLDLRDFAMLYRTNAQSRALEEALRRHAMPYRLVGAVRFYDRREIRDLMSYLKLVANPADDEAFRRAVAVPRRGVGDTTLDTLAERARAEGLPMMEAIRRPAVVAGLRPAARTALEQFAALLDGLRARARDAAVDELLRELVDAIRYGDYLKAEGEESAKERLDNVRELITSAAETMIDEGGEVGLSPLDHFLQRVSLVAAVDALGADADAVTLMTMHNAKGLEFPFVFITGLEDGLFPLARAYDDPKLLEEERRLFYVGITRARIKLYITHAQGRIRNGEFSPSKPSKFLLDVPEEMLDRKSTIKVRSSGRSFLSGHGGAYGAGWGRTGGGERRSAGGWEERAFAPTRRERAVDEDDIFPPSPAMRRPGTPVRRALPDPSEESQDAPILAPGARVKHRKFGSGTIAELSGNGRDAKAKIDFDDETVGRKTLVIAQANLERGDE
ncbi:MAG TPA: 3'-5' exonuclease, partial [Gemmatimonadaceae bacterium]|nr:3'-5' exonuclease [Gemmatimonadaceae bacterium]